MGYLKKSVKGFSWMVLLRGGTRILAFIRTAILARILTPEQFGVFGIASLALAFLEILTETGINAVLIQDKASIKKYMDTAWVVSMLRGAIIAVALFLVSRPVSILFSSPESFALLSMISVVPLIRGFINPAVIGFKKDLQFNKEFYLRFTMFLVDSAVSIAIALIYKSPIALVWGLIISSILEVLLTHVFIKPAPKFVFNTKIAKRLVKRGRWITASGIFNYLFQQGDDAVVGKMLGTYALGMYQMAYRISTLPMNEVSRVFHSFTFPVYVKINEDKNRLKTAYLKILVFVFLVVVPISTAILLFAEIFVRLLLGEKWLLIVPVLKVLTVYGFFRTLTGTTSSLFLAVEKQEYNTALGLVRLSAMGLTIYFFVSAYGIVGAGYSVFLGWLVSVPLTLFFILKVFGNRKSEK